MASLTCASKHKRPFRGAWRYLLPRVRLNSPAAARAKGRGQRIPPAGPRFCRPFAHTVTFKPAVHSQGGALYLLSYRPTSARTWLRITTRRAERRSNPQPRQNLTTVIRYGVRRRILSLEQEPQPGVTPRAASASWATSPRRWRGKDSNLHCLRAACASSC
jgi:hypothetical protein